MLLHAAGLLLSGQPQVGLWMLIGANQKTYNKPGPSVTWVTLATFNMSCSAPRTHNLQLAMGNLQLLNRSFSNRPLQIARRKLTIANRGIRPGLQPRS